MSYNTDNGNSALRSNYLYIPECYHAAEPAETRKFDIINTSKRREVEGARQKFNRAAASLTIRKRAYAY